MKAETQGSVYIKIVAPAAMVVIVGALFYLGSTLLSLDEAAIDKTLTGPDLSRLDSPTHDASAKSLGELSPRRSPTNGADAGAQLPAAGYERNGSEASATDATDSADATKASAKWGPGSSANSGRNEKLTASSPVTSGDSARPAGPRTSAGSSEDGDPVLANAQPFQQRVAMLPEDQPGTFQDDPLQDDPLQDDPLQDDPMSEELFIEERITVSEDGRTMKTEMTFTDPVNWEGEWKTTKYFRFSDTAEITEVNCIPAITNEGIQGL